MTRPIDADALDALIVESYHMTDHEYVRAGYSIVRLLIDKVPTIDAEPVRHGKWIYGNDFHWYTASCNKCGYQRKTDIKAEGWNQWKFCPNCGAKMQTGGD